MGGQELSVEGLAGLGLGSGAAAGGKDLCFGAASQQRSFAQRHARCVQGACRGPPGHPLSSASW
jgi:hypothetical protein